MPKIQNKFPPKRCSHNNSMPLFFPPPKSERRKEKKSQANNFPNGISFSNFEK